MTAEKVSYCKKGLTLFTKYNLNKAVPWVCGIDHDTEAKLAPGSVLVVTLSGHSRDGGVVSEIISTVSEIQNHKGLRIKSYIGFIIR